MILANNCTLIYLAAAAVQKCCPSQHAKANEDVAQIPVVTYAKQTLHMHYDVIIIFPFHKLWLLFKGSAPGGLGTMLILTSPQNKIYTQKDGIFTVLHYGVIIVYFSFHKLWQRSKSAAPSRRVKENADVVQMPVVVCVKM